MTSLYSHAPNNYTCPICLALEGVESDQTMIKQADFIYKDDFVAAFIASKFVGNNPGHVVIVPVKHYENIYQLPYSISHKISDLAQKAALGLKATRKCAGVMLMQNNEPASDQHAFHYHLHVFPRFTSDHLHEHLESFRVSKPSERLHYAKPLQTYFKTNSTIHTIKLEHLTCTE